MITEIKIGKIYKDVRSGDFREVIDIRGNSVAYWLSSTICGFEDNPEAGSMDISYFKETHEEYKEPLTFARIREEKPNFIKRNNVHYQCVGFDFNGDLLCLTSIGTTITFTEEEIKNWEIVK